MEHKLWESYIKGTSVTDRQVSDFEKAEYVEVEKSEDIEDVAPSINSDNQLQLESVAKRDSSNLLDKDKVDAHNPVSIDEQLLSQETPLGDLDDPRFNVPKEFKDHLKSYIDEQNYDSLTKQTDRSTK